MGAFTSVLAPRKETRRASVEDVAAVLARARHVVVLTGAGISAESGIPTFRDPADGCVRLYDAACHR